MKRIVIVLFILAFTNSAFSQDQSFNVMFYNVENLFDTIDDPIKRDEDFTPKGLKKWTAERYNKKIVNLSRVIASVNEKDLPEIVCLSEVENIDVVEHLFASPPLKKGKYQVILEESTDPRGIDVAFAYKPSEFKLLHWHTLQVMYTGANYPTRGILYVKGIAADTDTVHFFLNHWKSRSGGQKATEHKRVTYASVLKAAADSVLQTNSEASIIIIGDFNDEPANKSMKKVLKAKAPKKKAKTNKLYNLAWPWYSNGSGTYYFKTDWNMLDQVIVSGNIINKKRGLCLENGVQSFFIYRPAFIIHKSSNGVNEPSRTFRGKRYYGGYSDHFPVILKMTIR